MVPKDFTREDRFFLPSHDHAILAEHQPQYLPLPVVRLHGTDGRVISKWSLTDDERTAIAAGADIYVEQLTFNECFQPILPTVGLRDFCPKDS